MWCENNSLKKTTCEACWGRWRKDSMNVQWIGLITYNVPIHQLNYVTYPPPRTSPLQLIHTHPIPSFHLQPVSSPRDHCTACSLAVLPESWGFITSGSSGGLEKASICSCSNISSRRMRKQGNMNSFVVAACTYISHVSYWTTALCSSIE